VKDLILFLLIAVLIGAVFLAMKQADRQWDQIQAINSKLDDQAGDIHDIHSALVKGVVLANSGQTSTTKEAAIDPATDPFSRIRDAQKMHGYAKGDWYVDAFGNGVAKLTPLLSTDAYADEVQGFVLESLATRDPATLEWKPLLSTGSKISDDGLTITFTMRDGVQFSDGEPLTADDVVFTYNFIMNPKIAAPRDRAYLEKMKSVEKQGSNVVVFTYREPYFQAFELAASMAVMPKHFYEKFTPEEFNQSVGYLMGSGPYRLEDPSTWKPGVLIQLVRNDRYWGVPPAFDRLVWKEITNDVAHLTAFKNGDVDHFPAPPEQYRLMIQDPALLKSTQHFEYVSPRGGYRFVAWNQMHEGKPTRFADKRVRQAMTMLVDRERMIQEVMLGYAVSATGPFSPSSKQCDSEIKPWPYDVERAKRLLADAGFTKTNESGILVGPDGQPFEFKLTYPAESANYEHMVLFLKDSYARAGIKLDPDPLQWAIFTDRLDNKNFEAISLGWTAGIETDIYQMFDSSQMVAGGDDFMSYKNPELDKTIEEARRTVKEEPRMKLWHRAHQIIYDDQPYMFLWFGKSLQFIDKRIENIEILKLGMNPLEEWFVPKRQQKWEK
jgi:peptide/nickel transport system substrate-binding protein